MILVDTSVWTEHLSTGHPVLAELLQQGKSLGHPWAIGEIALGYVDVQLLAATTLTPDARLWTSNKRLVDAAGRLHLHVDPSSPGRP